jgi:hypothetical protein
MYVPYYEKFFLISHITEEILPYFTKRDDEKAANTEELSFVRSGIKLN